jgi:hypothetical protein
MLLSLFAPRRFRVPAGTVLLGLCLSLGGIAQGSNTTAAPAPFYKIISDRKIVIQPAKAGEIDHAQIEDVTPCTSDDAKKPKYACTDAERDGSQSPYSVFKTAPGTTPNFHGFNELTFAVSAIKSKRMYRLIYWQVDKSAGTGQPSVSTLNIDSSPTITVTYEPRDESGYLFRLESPLAFQNANGLLSERPTNCPNSKEKTGQPPLWPSVTLTSTPPEKKPGKSASTGELTSVEAWIDEDWAQADLKQLNPLQLGVIYVCLGNQSLKTDFTPDPASAAKLLTGITSALGPVDWSFAAGSKLSPAPPPTGKADAGFYANVTAAAGTGASFAWGIDGKVAWLQKQIKGGQLGNITLISATANTGSNTANIKSQTYTDSIGWTLPWSYLLLHSAPVPFTVLATVGPDYETDIKFDKKNMLLTADTMWTFKKLYQPQSYRTPSKNGALVKYPSPDLKDFGYGLQFHAGLEAGGALMNVVQKASTGSATIMVPSYSITRAVPQIRGLLQWEPSKSLGLLTLDNTFTGRYLFATENTVQQYVIPATGTKAATAGLNLRPLNGWRALNTLNATWNPPQNGHVGITATYNDGFNMPKFVRANSVVIGVTIMY